MPSHAGPNTLGESNLVFAIDTGDVRNSYIGEPTVNVLPSSNVLLTSYNDHGGAHVTDTGFTLFGNATLRNTSNPSQDWNGVYLTGLSSILTPGVTYTYSFYIYFTSDNTTISYFGYGAPGYTGVKGQWNRVSTTFTATTQDYFYVTLQYSNGQPVSTYYLANLQIEQKSNPTQFVNGTRSATQGLLPLIGNSTINLSNVSFDSNAQIVFDGTNDSMVVGNNATLKNNNTSIEFVIKYLNTPNGDIIQFGVGSGTYAQYYYRAYSGYSFWNWYPVGTGYGEIAIPNAALPLNQYHHIVMTGDDQGYVQFYINGIAQTGATRTSNTQPSNWTPADLTLGGFSWDGYSSSVIPLVKIYNRALTAQEVKQNYQQYKTRFNLS